MGQERLLTRLRGKAFQDGKAWRWEASLTIGDQHYADGIILTSPKETPFLSQEAAILDMQTQSPKILQTALTAQGEEIPREFMDLKRGIIFKA